MRIRIKILKINILNLFKNLFWIKLEYYEMRYEVFREYKLEIEKWRWK